jgi:hypothetical protein
MKRSIGTPLALFGLLLAAAMVCTTSAQGPKPEAPAVDPAAQPTPNPAAPTADPFAPNPAGGPRAATADDPFPSTPRRPVVASARAMPLVVGRYQAVSHNGKLIVLDTATGECYEHNGSLQNRYVWDSFAPPINPNAVRVNVRSLPSSAPN